MPISATGSDLRSPEKAGVQRRSWAPTFAGALSRRRESGFTLIELMIVLAIMGLVAAGVIMAMPDPRGRLSHEAERFAARTVAARDLAILQGLPVAVRVTAQGYAFDQRKGGAWAPIPDSEFRSQPWNRGTAALVGQGGTIRTAFDATGQPSAPAAVTLTRNGEQVRVAISADGGVRVGT
jgi:general secretion pathway protein H